MKQNKKKKKHGKTYIRISKTMRNVIHGYVMSDGYLNFKGILTVDQSLKQAKFVLWLYKQLKDIVGPKGIQQQTRIHSKTKQTSKSLRFWTKAALHGFHKMWYAAYKNQKGKTCYRKKLPHSLACFFDSLCIAVWFAGDGTKTIGSVGAKFEVTAFSPAERLRLKQLFFNKFNITTVIIKSGQSKSKRDQWALKIVARDYHKFRTLITQNDLISKLFAYKLHKKIL